MVASASAFAADDVPVGAHPAKLNAETAPMVAAPVRKLRRVSPVVDDGLVVMLMVPSLFTVYFCVSAHACADAGPVIIGFGKLAHRCDVVKSVSQPGGRPRYDLVRVAFDLDG